MIRTSRKTYDRSGGEDKLQLFRAKARENPRKFITNYLKIATKTPGAPMQNIKVWQGQDTLLNNIEQKIKNQERIRLVILKSRQRGISTLVAAMIFADCYNKDNMRGFLMAHDLDTTEGLFRKHVDFLRYLPSELQIKPKRSNQRELVWEEIGSELIIGTAGAKNTLRGRPVHWFHGSEAAFYHDLWTVKVAMEGSVPDLPGTGIIWETTAFGTGNAFHTLWNMAAEKDSIYEQVFLKWQDEEDCQLIFPTQRELDEYLEDAYAKKPDLIERQKHYNLRPEQAAFWYHTWKNSYAKDDQKMGQEFPCDPIEAFVSTGSPVFPSKVTAEWMLKTKDGTLYDPTLGIERFENMKEAAFLRRNDDTYLEVWVPPQKDRYYVISADPAAGLATSDYTVAYVFDIFTQDIVAELHGRIDPKACAKMVKELAELYNGALVAPENDGQGSSLLSHLKDQYFNIYQWRRPDAFGWKTTQILGWETTEQSRLEMVTTARRLFQERAGDREFIPSKMLLHEIATFVHGNLLTKKPQAEKGSYDDRVMAWCIGVSVCLQELNLNPSLALKYKPESAAKVKDDELKPSEIIRSFKTMDWMRGTPDFSGPFQMEGDMYDD